MPRWPAVVSARRALRGNAIRPSREHLLHLSSRRSHLPTARSAPHRGGGGQQQLEFEGGLCVRAAVLLQRLPHVAHVVVAQQVHQQLRRAGQLVLENQRRGGRGGLQAGARVAVWGSLRWALVVRCSGGGGGVTARGNALLLPHDEQLLDVGYGTPYVTIAKSGG